MPFPPNHFSHLLLLLLSYSIMHIPIIMPEKTASYGLWIMCNVFSSVFNYCHYQVFKYFVSIKIAIIIRTKYDTYGVVRFLSKYLEWLLLFHKLRFYSEFLRKTRDVRKLNLNCSNPVFVYALRSHNIRISLMGRHITVAKSNVFIYRDERTFTFWHFNIPLPI